MLTPTLFAQQLLAADAYTQTLASHQAWLRHAEHAADVVTVLKQGDEHVTGVDQWMRQDTKRARTQCALMERVANTSLQPTAHAMWHLAQGNLYIHIDGAYEEALSHLETARTLASDAGRPVLAARSVISAVIAYAHLGRFEEARLAGQHALSVFDQHDQPWYMLILQVNLAHHLYMRFGYAEEALQMLDAAAAALPQFELTQSALAAGITLNRTIALRHLGRFAAAEAACFEAESRFRQLAHTSEMLRARQNLGITWFMTGRYNEALLLLTDVQSAYRDNDHVRDMAMVNLFLCDGLLRLHQFDRVETLCLEALPQLDARGMLAEAIQLRRYQAIAAVRQGEFAKARTLLDAAHAQAATLSTTDLSAILSIDRAELAAAEQQWAHCLALAQAALTLWQSAEQVEQRVRSQLLVAIAHLNQSPPQRAPAAAQLAQVATTLEQTTLPLLSQQLAWVTGQYEEACQRPKAALAAYDRAIETAELLKGRLMIEHRIPLGAAQLDLYQRAITLSIAQGQFERALLYAERSRSRTLLDAIGQQLDLQLASQRPQDEALLTQLRTLSQRRDALYRQLDGDEQLRLQPVAVWGELQQTLVTYEQQITQLWQQLLMQNATYARDAARWQAVNEPVSPYLDPETLMLAYYELDGCWLVFVITSTGVELIPLGVTTEQLERWLGLFQLNCARAVSQSDQSMTMRLKRQADQLLTQLGQLLITPCEAWLSRYRAVVIVPYGALHHVPFHALRSADQYWNATHTLSYLPNAQLWRFMRPRCSKAKTTEFVAFGCSNQQQLQHATIEATELAQVMHGKAYVEDDATLAQVVQQVETASILHFATHGRFHTDNPLFSSLQLVDQQLTALDIFQLRLNCSLVTLSACQTGRHQVVQGDELLGLMRSFLLAGAASLLLTHWAVNDAATRAFMILFYTKLRQGYTKATAVTVAQQALMQANPLYTHPAYWAAFYLVGHRDHID